MWTTFVRVHVMPSAACAYMAWKLLTGINSWAILPHLEQLRLVDGFPFKCAVVPSHHTNASSAPTWLPPSCNTAAHLSSSCCSHTGTTRFEMPEQFRKRTLGDRVVATAACAG